MISFIVSLLVVVGIVCCQLVSVLGNEKSLPLSSTKGRLPLCFAKSAVAVRKKGSGSGFGGGFGKAKGGVEEQFILSKKAKKLLKKHGNNIDAASQDFFLESTANLVAASLSMDELHAEKVKATWDTVALFLPYDYARNKGKIEPHVERRIRHIATACRSDTANGGPISILDVGCGDGAIVDSLNESGKVSYQGIDISSEMIQLGRKRHPTQEFTVGSFPDDVSGNEKFDTILFNGSLQFFKDTRQTLMDACEKLKPVPGARIVLSHVNGAKFVREECQTSMGVAVRKMPNKVSLEDYAYYNLNMKVTYKTELLDTSNNDYDEELDGDDDQFYLVVLERKE